MLFPIGKLLLWLFVINLGVAFGAGLYESRIEFPRWLSPSGGSTYRWDAEAAREADTGLNFWVYVTTVPLTLLTLANIAAAWRFEGDARGWWLAAALIALAERVFTFSYFVPTMIRLMGGGLPEPEAAAAAAQWGQLNYLRHALSLAGLVAALKAFSLLGR